MKCSYHSNYELALSSSHPFPMSKYPLLRRILEAEGLLAGGDLLTPEPLQDAVLALVHTPDYLAKLASGGLTETEQRRLGLPWSENLWLRSRLAAGGTLLAARAALAEGFAANLAGGTHHAFADHGEGFCVLNDVALAITQLRREQRIERAVVIDLDVHQGNGTASIFSQVSEVFTFSIHGARNYPAVKMRSTLDVALEDGTGDAEYLAALDGHLDAVLDAARADMAFYIAGVDVVAGDRYGRFALSEAGLSARDARVMEAVVRRRLPTAIVLGGGYAPTPERTAALHANVFREAGRLA